MHPVRTLLEIFQARSAKDAFVPVMASAVCAVVF